MRTTLPLAGTGALTLPMNRLFSDHFAFFPLTVSPGGLTLFRSSKSGVVDKFFLHRGGNHHNLVFSALPWFDQPAHTDLSRESVLFPKFVPLQQFVEGLDAG